MRFVRELLLRHLVVLIAEDADCIVNYQILVFLAQKSTKVGSLTLFHVFLISM